MKYSKFRNLTKSRPAKMLLILSIILFCCGMASCSANHYVPTQLVYRDVEKYFSDYDIMFNTVSHNYDAETHIDTVEVNVSLLWEYSTDNMTVTAMYRYNKSNDTWDLYDSIKYRDKTREYRESAYIGHWEGYFNITGKYDVYITDVDFERMTITGTFNASANSYSLKTELAVTGEFSIEGDSDYLVRINNQAYTFTFRLDPHYGFKGVNIVNTRDSWS